MNGRRLAFLGLSGAAVLSVAAAIGLGADALRLDSLALAGRASTGTTGKISALERDLANLRTSLAGVEGEMPVSRYSELRSGVAATLATEAMSGRLQPQDIEQLARLARDLDRLVVSGAITQGSATAANELAAHATELAAMGAALRLRETDAAAAQGETIAVGAGRTVQALVAAALALVALSGALVMRRPALTGIDPAVVAAQQTAMDEAARLARARFVMMMSHELRTPLNGVLGLLSVMKEANPPDALRPLIEQAERAGHQLTAMLHDMLEVESGATEATRPAPSAPANFSPRDLAQSIKDLYAPISALGGPALEVTTKGPVPDEATGDGLRFQRAVSHLCSHVMDTAGVEDVKLEVSHNGDEVRAELSFAHKAGPEAGLRLVEPEAGSPEAGDEVTGVGLGPLLAKGLLEQMGGRLEIATLDSGRILVLAASPSSAVDNGHRPRVRVIARTRSLGALGTAAASAAGVDVLSAESAPSPDIVLVEAGGEEEARAVGEARRQWPTAHVMALGTPDVEGLFDDAIQPPLEPVRVAEAVTRAWANRQQGGAALSSVAPVRKVG